MVRTNGIRLHCAVAGDGPLVILLHGFPETWRSWRHQIPVLAERCRVVAPDLRGYNESEKPASVAAYAMPELVADDKPIALAREAGFTIAEIKRLVSGFKPGTPPATRWAELATRKLAEIDAMVARAERMRAVLKIALDCGCFRLDDCSALLDARPIDGQSPCILPANARRAPQRASA